MTLSRRVFLPTVIICSALVVFFMPLMIEGWIFTPVGNALAQDMQTDEDDDSLIDDKSEKSAEPEDEGPPPDRTTEIVTDITVRGNGKVESEAIITLLKTTKGDPFSPTLLVADIKALYELGYFSDVRIFKKESPGGIALVIQVAEKPSIGSIEFNGLDKLKEDDFKDKMETKLYTIVNESKIMSDQRMIEKQYVEKGYYLAQVTYDLKKKDENEVALTFNISEGKEVRVGEVAILGNQYFSDKDIITKLASWPYCRTSAISGSSLFQDDFVKRDLEFISYYYRDWGFAEVKVAKPLMFLDRDRQFVRVTFQVEEGIQYYVGLIDVSGDVLFPKEELFAAMKLKPGSLFRHSHFAADVEMLIDKYGDLGYAYVDVRPKEPMFDREKKIVNLNYEITKGEKVYFGDITVVGNKKTRDNVVRRELEVHDSELYSGTKLAESKSNVQRLGFFEEVQVLKERDLDEVTLLNLKVKVKEKPTGQLQASLGFSPGQGNARSNWFGMGTYDEKNQSGKAWETMVSGRWNGEENYDFKTSFTDPRVNDSNWSAGISLFYLHEKTELTDGTTYRNTTYGGGPFVGRKIIELIRGKISYKLQKTIQQSETFITDRFREDGIASSVTFGLYRRDLDNYLEPTDGSEVYLDQTFTGGSILRGDQEYLESSANANYYFPVDYTDTFRTHFKLLGLVSYIYPMGSKPVPYAVRYRLGGYNDMRGFEWQSIGPTLNILRAPGVEPVARSKGGDKKVLFQVEYFIPLIPEAGIKALLFHDIGRVYDDPEALVMSGFYRDIGFGFRWMTPIAPFRFEWAYPIVDGKVGEMKIQFSLGY